MYVLFVLILKKYHKKPAELCRIYGNSLTLYYTMFCLLGSKKNFRVSSIQCGGNAKITHYNQSQSFSKQCTSYRLGLLQLQVLVMQNFFCQIPFQVGYMYVAADHVIWDCKLYIQYCLQIGR